MAKELATEYLLYCLRWLDDETNVEPPEMLSDMNWENFIRIASRHSIIPMAYQRIKSHDSYNTIPVWVLEKLREKYHQIALESVRYFAEFSNTLYELSRVFTPVIVVKGAHLAGVVYEHNSLRPMTDLDLLVKKEDLVSISGKLISLGYKSSRPYSMKDEMDIHHHLPPLVKEDALPVEIHWSLLNPDSPFKEDTIGLWERANSEVISGVNVKVLSADDLLLYLCLHMSYSHNLNFGIRPFVDIAEVVRYYASEINWQTFIDRTLQWRAARPVFLTLYLEKDLLKTPIPDYVLTALLPDEFDIKLSDLARSVVLGSGESPILSKELSDLGKAESLINLLPILLKRIFLSPKEIKILYPSLARFPWIIVGYFKRFLDLTIKYGRVVIKMIRKDRKVLEQAMREETLRNWFKS